MYFELLAQKDRYERRGSSTDQIVAQMMRLKAKHESKSGASAKLLSTDTFSVIADWQHLVLRQIAKISAPISDMEHIRRRFYAPLTTATMRESLARLERVQLIQRDDKGHLRSSEARLQTTDDIANAAIKAHHNQMLDLAKRALQQQSIREREFQGVTTAIDPKDIPAAKEFLRSMLDEFEQRFAKFETNSEVYQLNLQMFAHTKPILERGIL